MRIDAMNQVSQIYQKNGIRKVSQANKPGSADRVEISQLGKDMQVAKAAVKAASDVRTNRVEELKAAVANGTYSVSNEALADKLASLFGA